MADRIANGAGAEQRVSQSLDRVAWMRVHRRVVTPVCLASIVAIFAVDLVGRPDDWVLSVFYLLPLAVLAVTLRQPRLVAAVGVGCIVATFVDGAVELDDLRHQATFHAFLGFLALATIGLYELTSFIVQSNEVSRRAIARAHLAEADAEIVAVGARGLELDEVLERSLERVTLELGAAVGVVLTQSDDHWVVQASNGAATIGAGSRLPLAAVPLPGTAFDDPEPVAISDLSPVLDPTDSDPAHEIARLDIAVAVAVPMVAFRTRRGVLLLGRSAARGDLAREEARFVADVAGHLAASIENAELIQRLGSRERYLSLVLDSSLDFVASLDPQQIIEAIVKRLVDALQMSGCDLHIVVEPERTTVRTVISLDHDEFDAAPYVGATYPLDEFTSTAHVIETREPLSIVDFSDPRLSERERELLVENEQASQFSLPLVSGERVIGVVELFNRGTPRVLSDEEVELAVAMCRFAALALDNAQLYERAERRNKALRDLVEMGSVISTARDVDDMLRKLAARLHEALDLCDVDVFLLDGDELWSRVSYDRTGFDEQAVGHYLRVDEFGTTRRAIDTKRPAIVRPSELGALSELERSVFEQFGFLAAASVPMVVEGRIQGMIDVYDDRPRDFSDDADFLTTVGALVAASLEKQILLEQVSLANVRLRELVELGAVVWRSRDIQALVRQVAQRLVRATGATCCQLFRLERGALRCAVDFDIRTGFDESLLGRSLRLLDHPTTAAAIDRREPFVFVGRDDERLGPVDRRLFEEHGFEAELCVPLVIEDRVVGLLDIFDERRRDFSSSLDFLVTAGQMIAGAFDNVALLDRLDRTNRELEALVDSSLEFGSTLELEKVLVAIASRIREVAGVALCEINAYEQGVVRGLVSVSPAGVSETFAGSEWDPELYSVRMLVETKEPMVVSDREHSDVITERERDEWREEGIMSALRLPLVSRGRLYGWISLFDDHVREFARVGFLRGLAQIAAQAVINASLFAELDESTRHLRQVNEASLDLASTLSLETVLHATAERLCDVAGVPCCDIYTIEAGDLVCRASVKDGQASLAWVGTRVALGEWGSDALAIETRSTVVLDGADDAQRSAAEKASLEGTGFESQLTVPLLATDRAIGVIQLLDRKRGRRFAVETIATIEAITRAAALAIGNAELFDAERETSARLERLAAQLQSLQEISLRLNRLREQGPVLEEVLRGGAGLLGVERAAYAVRDGEVVQLEAFYSASDPGLRSEREAEAALETLGDVLPRLSLIKDTPAGVEVSLEQRAVVQGDTLVVPLRRHRADAVAALVFAEKIDGSSFGAEEERLATTLAAQLSLTLRNVRAFQREHEIAEEFQNALLETPPAIDGVDLGVRYAPAGQAARVGGDFYDIVQLGPRRFMVAIGDVCGRGLTAAVQTAMVRYMLRAYVGESSPGEALSRLNATMAAQAPEMPFLTMIVAYVDVERGSFDYAVAGHPRPLVIAGGATIELPDEGSYPIGVFPTSVYPTNRSVLPSQATVVLFTDGLIEARRNDEQIRETGLERMVRRHFERSPQELADTLVARARRYGGAALDDDMAVVVLRFGGRASGAA